MTYPYDENTDRKTALRNVIHEAVVESRYPNNGDRNDDNGPFDGLTIQTYWIDLLVRLLRETDALYTLRDIVEETK